MGLPPGSSPWLRRCTTLVSPILSMSNTAVESGYGPVRGGSPVMMRMLCRPAAAAPSRSLIMPSMFRSRQV